MKEPSSVSSRPRASESTRASRSTRSRPRKFFTRSKRPRRDLSQCILFDEGATVECGVAVAVIAESGRGCRRRSRRATAKSAAEAGRSRLPHIAAARQCPAPRSPTPARGAPQVRLRANSRPNLASISTKSKAPVPVDGSLAKTSSAARDQRAKVQPANIAAAPSGERVAIRGVRKVIAERMHQSLHSSAQITIAAEADVTPATEFRARRSREFDFSYTDMMIHSVARALMRHPRMNARLEGAEIVLLRKREYRSRRRTR